ncbi:transmembrane and coiled-coil domain-containing protein 4-like isoform X2 [Symsagittifera roscoffensis]|uniref:transmembrane and coiled-coil domain-containing protein 4-like isoform X2 n=1 Tax=Symsagittifera roscoffensis TaxID=84072 RepID=UPI00307BD072
MDEITASENNDIGMDKSTVMLPSVASDIDVLTNDVSSDSENNHQYSTGKDGDNSITGQSESGEKLNSMEGKLNLIEGEANRNSSAGDVKGSIEQHVNNMSDGSESITDGRETEEVLKQKEPSLNTNSEFEELGMPISPIRAMAKNDTPTEPSSDFVTSEKTNLSVDSSKMIPNSARKNMENLNMMSPSDFEATLANADSKSCNEPKVHSDTTRADSVSSGIFSLVSADSTTNSASLSPASSTSSVEMMDLELNKLKTSTKFSYATLVAVLLGDTCRLKVDNKEVLLPSGEECSKLHEKYLREFLHGLKNHLELPESIEQTLYSHALVEDGMAIIEDYVQCILMDPHFEFLKEQKASSSTKTSDSQADLTSAEKKETSSADDSGYKAQKEDNMSSILVLDSLQVSMRKGTFDARSRELCMRLSKSLGFSQADYEIHEASFVDFMQSAAEQYQMSTEEKKAQEASKKKSKRKRYFAIGLAAVGGGALIGLTGGLAAPFVAGGIGALIGGAGAAFMASTAGLVVITSIFGTGGAGLVGYKMKRRVGNVEQFEFTSLSDKVGLHVAIAIPGWLREGEVISQQWAALDISPEQYCLLWETKYLLELGSSLQYLKDMVVNAAMSQALKLTVLSSVMAAIAWPAALLSASSVIDNPWSVANSRSVQAGKQLAEVLLTRQHGCRPVTLVGVSLGAKLIYQCLEEISSRGASALGIIHNIVLIGAPCSGRPEDWVKLAPLISGQVINAFSQGDWMLKFIYRSSSLRAKIAGLGPIPLEPKIVNIDLTEVIQGHLDYLERMPEVLSFCGVKCKAVKQMLNKFSLSGKNLALESGETAGSSASKSEKETSKSMRNSTSFSNAKTNKTTDGSEKIVKSSSYN